MTTGPTVDRGQKKKRIVTLALMAIFLMSASFFLIDRKEETIIVVSFPNGRELEAEVADTPEKLLVGLAKEVLHVAFERLPEVVLRDVVDLEERRVLARVVRRAQGCPARSAALKRRLRQQHRPRPSAGSLTLMPPEVCEHSRRRTADAL